MLFNPERIFIYLEKLHGAYLYAFQSKNNISFFCAFGFNWMQLDWKTTFPIQNFELNSIHNLYTKNCSNIACCSNIEAILLQILCCMSCEYCSIQNLNRKCSFSIQLHPIEKKYSLFKIRIRIEKIFNPF